MKFITSPLPWMEIRLDEMKLCCDKIHELLGSCSCCFIVVVVVVGGDGGAGNGGVCGGGIVVVVI